jgi:MGT family glycosyltransferase
VFNSTSGDLLERLLAAVSDVDADVLVTVGPDLDPTDFGVQPEHVRLERFVPQADALADADLVVSHGGSGSLMATLAHGLPSVLLPLGADQPHNARRAGQLGLAKVLDAVAAGPGTIRKTIEDAMDDRRLLDRARAVAQEIDRLPGVDGTVPSIEALVTG